MPSWIWLRGKFEREAPLAAPRGHYTHREPCSFPRWTDHPHMNRATTRREERLEREPIIGGPLASRVGLGHRAARCRGRVPPDPGHHKAARFEPLPSRASFAKNVAVFEIALDELEHGCIADRA